MPKLPPEEWKSAGDPMTEAQASYLRRLCASAGQPFDDSLTKAQASRRIEELRSGDGGGTAAAKAGGARQRSSTGQSTPVGADDPMTEAQAAYLRELIEDEPGEEFDESLSREAASQRIAELLVKHMEHSPSAASHR
jgi:Protein of unknown function (DUF3072)